MAWMNQERKAEIKAALDKVVPKGWKYTLSVNNHSTIVMTVKSAPFDVIAEVNRVHQEQFGHHVPAPTPVKDHFDVNQYYPERSFDVHLPDIEAILDALNLHGKKGSNYDNSDIQTDYFDVGWYVKLQFGRWNQPFVYGEAAAKANAEVAAVKAKVKKALPHLFGSEYGKNPDGYNASDAAKAAKYSQAYGASPETIEALHEELKDFVMPPTSLKTAEQGENKAVNAIDKFKKTAADIIKSMPDPSELTDTQATQLQEEFKKAYPQVAGTWSSLPPKINVLTTEEYEAVKAKVKTKLYSTDQGKALAKGQVYWVKEKK